MEGGGASKRSSSLRDDAVRLVSGGIAGCVAKSATAPFDRVKILYQINSPHYPYLGVFKTIGAIVKKEGFTALWKGNLSTIARVFPYAAIQFLCYDHYYAITMSHLAPIPFTKYFPGFISGALAGGTATCFTYPLDIVRARMAAQVDFRKYRGMFHGMRSMIRDEGYKALMKGMGPTLWGVFPYAGISFGTNDSLKKLYISFITNGKNEMSFSDIPAYVRLLCGGLAGLTAQTATYPLDLVRRQMQLAGFAHTNSYPYDHQGTFDGLRRVLAREGIRGLYKGLSINFVKAGPMVGLSFTTNDLLKKWFGVSDVSLASNNTKRKKPSSSE